MWPLFLVLCVLGAFSLSVTSTELKRPYAEQLQSDAVALNMLVYDRAAALFAAQNPAFAGEVTPSMIQTQLPSGYQNLGGWRSYVHNRHMLTTWTNNTRRTPDIADALVRHTDGQLFVGRMSTRAEDLSAGPLTCWGFVAPAATCVQGTDYPYLLVNHATIGAPIVLRRLPPV